MKRLVALVFALVALAEPAAAFSRTTGWGAVPGSFIVPGSTPPASWTATATPAAQGNPADYGYSEPAIANWDDVPFQTFSGGHTVCVAAFHLPTAADYAAGITSNIQKVSFAINNGAWLDVTTPTVGSPSGLEEYCAQIRASDLADGQFEVRAIAYPTTGVPFVLQGAVAASASVSSMFLNANANGSLPATVTYVSNSGTDTGNCTTQAAPCLTISYARDRINSLQSSDVGGGVVYLAAGSYAWGAVTENNNRTAGTQWFTVSAAPGVDPATVLITSANGSSGIRVSKVHMANMTVTGVQPSLKSGITTAYAWVDHVTWVGSGQTIANVQPFNASAWVGGKWCDSVVMSLLSNGCISSTLVRNSSFDHIGSDAFTNVHTVLHSSVQNIEPIYFATGDITADSPLVTNLTNQTNMYVGSAIAAIGIPNAATIASIDSPTQITMSRKATQTRTGITFGTGFHPDVYQLTNNTNASMSNYVFYGVTANTHINAQGGYIDQVIYPGTASDIAIVNYTEDNSENSGRTAFQANSPTTNMLWIDSSWLGGPILWRTDVHFAGTDISIIDNTCQNTFVTKPGITVRGSPTCQ